MPLILTWANESTLRNPEGGDTINGRNQELYIEGEVTEGRNVGVDISVHPVERNQDVSDHVHNKLDIITAECFVSDTPLNANVEEDNHVQNVEDTLDEIIRNAIPVDVENDRRVYEQYLIADINYSRDNTTGDGITFVLTFQKLKIADVQLVDAPAPTVERGRNRQDAGRRQGQEGQNGSGSTDPSERTSTLAAAREAVQERGGITGVLGSLTGG